LKREVELWEKRMDGCELKVESFEVDVVYYRNEIRNRNEEIGRLRKREKVWKVVTVGLGSMVVGFIIYEVAHPP